MIYKLLFVIILASSVLAQEEDGSITAPDSFTVTGTGFWEHYTTTTEWVEPPYSECIYEFLELAKEYETECWNDSTEQCFNYYVNNYKTLCYEGQFDLAIDMNYKGTGKEWLHKDPTFIGFIEYLRNKQ